MNKDLIHIPVSELEIKLDPTKTTAYDFTVEDFYTFCTHDGVFVQDSMAVYLPITPESQEEAKRQALSTKMLINPTNMQIITIPSQEMVLGLYLLSTIKTGKYGNKCIYKKTEMTNGMAIINKCFPKEYRVVNEPITSKVISAIIYDIYNKHPDEIVEVLDKIKTTGFKYATLIGHTISLKGMTSNEDIKNDIYKEKTAQEQLNKISSPNITKYLQEHFAYSDMIESGARGSWDQARQLILTRGFVSDFSGNILPTPIKNCLIDGLTPTEFFLSSYGCRKGLLDIAIKTASSGYLFRKFLFACSNLMIDYDNEDCGTTDLLGIYINDIKKAYAVKGRWYAPDISKPDELELITDFNLKNIIKKRIFIRSPIYCKSEKLCKKCYGKLYEYINNSRFVGSIAAQSLGESNTQLVLRSFHTSIKCNTKIVDVNNNSYTVEEVYNKVKSGEDFYTFSCSPDGEIVVTKVIDAHRDRFEKTLLKITLDNGEFIECSHDHEWILRNGEHARADQLKIGDSLMPIYFGTRNGYLTVKQNYKVKHSSRNKFDAVYRLSAFHRDVNIHENLTNAEPIHHHHIDKNKSNNYPTNIMILNPKHHLKMHRADIAESNRRRVKDPEFVKQFNERRNKTMEENNSIESMRQKKIKYFQENPDKGKEIIAKVRIQMIKNNIQKLIDDNIPLTNENYDKYRYTKHCPTFEYATNNYPELVKDFEIVQIETKSKNQLHAEARVSKIKEKMIEENLEFNVENFNKANEMIYPNPRFRWSIDVIGKYSADSLDFLVDYEKPVISDNEETNKRTEIPKHMMTKIQKTINTMKENNIKLTNENFDNMKLFGRSPKFKYVYEMAPELVEDFEIIPPKSNAQKNAESRIYKIKEKMIEENLEFNVEKFNKANEMIYPNPKFRRNIDILYRNAPDELSFLPEYNHKVVKIEEIEYDEYQNLYDLTVDSEYHNFATGAGVFIHNSGVAQIKSNNDDTSKKENMKQEDIVGDLSSISTMVHKFSNDTNAEDLVNKLYHVYSADRFFMLIHFECLVSQLMWSGKHKWRLLENRNDVPCEFVSIVSVPSRESWLMGLAFSNTKRELINGLLNPGLYSGGVIDRILCGVSYENI